MPLTATWMLRDVQLSLTVADAALPQRLIETLAQSDVVLILCTVDELFHLELTRSSAGWLLQLTTWWIIRLLLCVVLLDSCLLTISAHSSSHCCSHSMTLHSHRVLRMNDSINAYLKHIRDKQVHRSSEKLHYSTKLKQYNRSSKKNDNHREFYN